jgi:uncharacterized protein (DUF1810 family)
MAGDPFNLRRFVAAQESIYAEVIAELLAGAKTSHWMWFVFPQIRGLGHSPIAREFALAGRTEARAYFDHELLGPRLIECTKAVLQVSHRTLRDIFGTPDDLKFRSSMTLFARAASEQELFEQALRKYCGGEGDPRTLALLDIPP